jgi:hypothetical protein
MVHFGQFLRIESGKIGKIVKNDGQVCWSRSNFNSDIFLIKVMLRIRSASVQESFGTAYFIIFLLHCLGKALNVYWPVNNG